MSSDIFWLIHFGSLGTRKGKVLMSFLRFLRGVFAVGVGCIATFVLAPLGSLYAITLALLGCDDVSLPSGAVRIIGLWGCFLHHWCIEWLLGVSYRETGTIARADPDEVVICICNHPSSVAASTVACFLWEHVAQDFYVIAKKEYKKDPFIGAFLKLSRSVIFVDRSCRLATAAAITDTLEGSMRKGTAILLFPDLSRPTKAKVFADRLKYAGKIEGLERWPPHTLVPHPGALEAILEMFPDQKMRVVDMTIGCDRDDSSLLKWCFLSGAKLFLSVKQRFLSRMPREELVRMLNEEWKYKNIQIDNWKRK